MEKACASSFLLFTLDKQELSSPLLSPWWRTRCCSWREWHGGSARLLLAAPWAHRDAACALAGCFHLQQALGVSAAGLVCLREHTALVWLSAVSHPWVCHMGEPEAELEKDGCCWEVSEGTYFWIHGPFVSRPEWWGSCLRLSDSCQGLLWVWGVTSEPSIAGSFWHSRSKLLHRLSRGTV